MSTRGEAERLRARRPMPAGRFSDRRDAGRQLAPRLRRLALADPVVLGLPRGGIPVGYEIAAALGVPLEVFGARKIGAPGHPELGIAAIAEGLDEPVTTDLAAGQGLSPAGLAVLVTREREVLDRRVARYRGDRPLPPVGGRDVIVVDDGVATGVTAEAALVSLRRRRPRRLLLAAPVCSAHTARRLDRTGVEVVCLHAPDGLFAVGFWYVDFAPTTDREVTELLERSRTAPAGPR